MLYFAYGSNLHHFQMKRRCKDSIYLKKINLKNFRLTFRSKYRAADIEPKKNSIVPGGLFEISKSDEKKLDVYEDYPILYKKHYFYYYGKKVNNKTGFGLCLGFGISLHSSIGLFQAESRISSSLNDIFKNTTGSHFSSSKNLNAELSLSYLIDYNAFKKASKNRN